MSINSRKGKIMSENSTENKRSEKSSITAGVTALISVLAVPVTLLAGLLLSNKRKR
jgi:hypothetical protein